MGTANATPTETELPTPTSGAADASPASVALRNTLRSVFRTDEANGANAANVANGANAANRNLTDQDLPVFDAPLV